MSSTLLYAVVPRFYAEIERAAHPELAERPIIVGGDPRKGGVVQAASETALAAGVEVGMSMQAALARCRRARALATDMRRYREVASRLRACFRRVTGRVEPAGLDAAYLDLAVAARRRPGSEEEPAEAIAVGLQRAVRAELGLPLRTGIAPLKFLARLAAEEADATGIRRVGLADVSHFLHPLPVARLPGVGPRTLEVLEELGARRVGDVVGLGRRLLEERLGNHGLAILALAEGREDSRIRATPHPRSLSQETTLEDGESDRAVLQERLASLASGLEKALALEALNARRVVLKLRYADAEGVTRTRTLEQPVASARRIAEVASELLGRTQAGERRVRRLGIGLALLAPDSSSDQQLELFGAGD